METLQLSATLRKLLEVIFYMNDLKRPLEFEAIFIPLRSSPPYVNTF